MVCDPDFDPIGKSGDRVGPNAPPVSERHLRRVVGAAVPPCAHTDARVFPRPGSTASRDEMSGVDHGCVSSSRAPLAPACSAPPHDLVPRPVPYRPPVVPDLTIASPAHLRPTGASPALTASSMTSAARSPWAPSAAAR